MKTTVIRIAAALLVLLFTAVPVFAQSADEGSDTAHWSAVYPILGWLPLYGADLRLPSGPPCSECPSGPATGDASSSGLSGAWFAGMRLEMGRFEVLGNINYAGLSAERDRPFFKAKVDLVTAAILGGVRVYGPLFLEAGARYHGFDASLNLLAFPNIDWKPGRWAPAVGATFRPGLSKSWRLYTHIDWGGLGVHDVSTVNGEARLEWRPVRHFALTGGYGFGKVTLNSTLLEHTSLARPIHFEQTLHGPVAGIGIPF